MKILKVVTVLVSLISGLFAQDVDKFFKASDGEIIGILSLGKKTLSITGTVKRVIWTGINGETIILEYDGFKLKSDCKIILKNNSTKYNKGVNDALQIIMLHDLELTLQNKNMTWGERADTVRARLNVPIKRK